MTTTVSISVTNKSYDKTAALVFKNPPHNDGNTIRESMSLVKLIKVGEPFTFSVYEGQVVEVVEIPDPTYIPVQPVETSNGQN